MAFKFVTVLCLVTLVAAGDYEYNKPSGGNFNAKSNDNYNEVTTDGTNNVPNPNPADSYHSVVSENNIDNYQKDNNNRQYNDAPYPASEGYQSANANKNDNYYYNDNVEYYAPAKYEYAYSVNEPSTGDIKSHAESRDGYYVRGIYSLLDSDGYKRVVTYTADNVNGFNAVVKREPYAVNGTAAPALKSSGIADANPTEAALKSQETKTPLLDVRDTYTSPPAIDGNGPYA